MNYTLKSDNNTAILNKFYEFINATTEDNGTDAFWGESKYFKHPEDDFLDVIKNAKNHKMTLLSINNIDDHRSLVKVAWIKNNDNFGNLYAIYNFIAFNNKNEIIFENVLDYNTKDFKTFTVDEIKYVIHQDHELNRKIVRKMVTFNKKMALFFEKDIMKFTYLLCKDMKQFKGIRGFDFDSMMVDQNQIGGETFPADNLIFAGNDSEFYPHEVVHLYTYQHFRKIHKIVDEGLATYFGGSKGIKFEDHILKLKDHLNEKDLNVYEELFNKSEHYILDDTTSLWYTIGALLCDITLKKYGKEGLFNLMNSGKTNDELLLSLEKIFKIKKEDLDGFIKSELKNY